MRVISAELLEQIYREVKSLVDNGWFRNEDDIIL